jgi:branched-chain amino acid transport system substrate-binding protein
MSSRERFSARPNDPIDRRTVLRGGAGLIALSAGLPMIGCAGNGAQRAPVTEAPAQQQPPVAGSFGTGPVRVGLLLPLTAAGNAGATGQALRNAAELAIAERDPDGVVVMPFDTQGNAQGARQAATQAVAAGAQLLVGPLFSAEVAAAGQAAGQANVPVIAFSSDPNAAGRNVYLLSFLAQSDIELIVSYATRQGKKAFGAVVPDSAYGSVVEGALRQSAARNGASVILIQRYKPDTNSITVAMQQIGAAATGSNPSIDALLMPDGATAIPFLAQAIQSLGIETNRVQLLGSGQWDDPRVLGQPVLKGGWYAAPPPEGWSSFVQRYQGRYQTSPPRIASLSFDAMRLAMALANRDPQQPFPPQLLTNRDGFAGTDGLFRLRPDGLNDRGLAILEVDPPGSRVIAPGARSFQGSGI